MRALDLKSTVRGKYVESAKLILYENGANTKGVKINVEPVKNDLRAEILHGIISRGVQVIHWQHLHPVELLMQRNFKYDNMGKKCCKGFRKWK